MSVSPALRRMICAALAAFVTFAAPLPLPAQSQAPLIVIPLDEAVTGEENEEATALTDRLYLERGHGVDADASVAPPFLSPLRPARAGVPTPGGIMRVSGEHETVDLVLFVADPTEASRLRIFTQSSINVLPERSDIRVFVNGEYLGAAALGNFTDFEAAEFDLPAAVLQPGPNRVRVQVVQHHRIFCGPEASFGLWTDINLALSGATLAEGVLPLPGIDAFLMGLSAQAAQDAPVEIRGAASLGPGWEAWIGRLIARLGGTLSGAPMRFEHGDYWTMATDAPARARITFLPGLPGRVSYRIGGDGAIVMIIEHDPGQPLTTPPDLDAILPVPPATAGLPLVTPGREVAFGDFGFETFRISRRYFRGDYSFRLPDDWVILTAAKARIRIDYAYAEGLPEGAMLLLIINGETVRLLPMEKEGGRLITRFPVDFEARLLRAGANVLSLEMLVPGDPPDLPCPTHSGPMLEVRASSTLHVPQSPSMVLPDLVTAFAALDGSSLRVSDNSLRSFSPEEMLTLGSALTRLGPSSTRRHPPRLHLVALDDLGSVPVGQFQVSRRVLEDVLLLDDTPIGGAQFTVAGVEAEQELFYREFSRSGSGGGFSAIWARTVSLVERAAFWMHPQSGQRLENWLMQQRGQAMLLQLDYAQPNDLWLVRGRDADMGDIAAEILRARATGVGPFGQVAILGRDGQWRNWVAPDRRPVLIEPLSMSNIRVVLGNYASALPALFVIIIMCLGVISAIVALRLIISTREKSS